MRGFCLIFACVTMCGLADCEATPKIDLTPVTSSPLPSMQKYNGYIGKDYWLTALLRGRRPFGLYQRRDTVECDDRG
jgi:hypothetical protein